MGSATGRGMRTGGAWCSRCSSTPKTGGKRSAACPSCARRWMPSRIPSTACSSTAVAAAGQVPGSPAGRSPRRARLPFRCPGPRTSRIWIWRLSPHRPPGRRRQGRYSGRRIHAVPGLAEMTLTDTVPVLRPSVRGTEELAAIGRSVTGRECLKTVPCARFVMDGLRMMRCEVLGRAYVGRLCVVRARGTGGARIAPGVLCGGAGR